MHAGWIGDVGSLLVANRRPCSCAHKHSDTAVICGGYPSPCHACTFTNSGSKFLVLHACCQLGRVAMHSRMHALASTDKAKPFARPRA
jgi:hypothetical protein